MNLINQRDIRWGNINIGNSNSKIKDFGCTICCLSMQAGINPDEFNSRMTAVGGFQNDLIIWQKINEAIPWLKFPNMGRHYSYDNELVKQAISKYGSCLVEVDFDGIIHWVLYFGNGRCIDPWTGRECSTSKYPLRKGYCIIEVLQKETMTEETKRILDFIGDKTEGDVRQAFGALADSEGKNKQILTLTNKVSELELHLGKIDKALAELKSNYIEKEKLETKLQKAVSIANSKIDEQSLTIEELDRKAKDNWNLYDKKCREFNEYKETEKIDTSNELTFKELIKLIIKKILKQ